MQRKIRHFILLLIMGLVPAASMAAGPPLLQVLPWNGHKAAASLTFDDGLSSQLDIAVPELDQRGLKGTFFLIANRITRKDDWRKILKAGHEIGNHTLDHKHAGGLNANDVESQVLGAQHVLQKEFGISVPSFAYPFSETTPELKAQVEKYQWLARRGGNKWVPNAQAQVDWWDVPSRKTQTELPFSTYQKWMDANIKTGGWAVWTVHSLDRSDGGYEPITKEMFSKILDYLRKKDIWVGTFLEVGTYWRAEKIFESAQPTGGKDQTWTWDVPNGFSKNVILKLKFDWSRRKDKLSFEIWQGRQKITPDENGVYPINFDLGSLSLRPLPNP